MTPAEFPRRATVLVLAAVLAASAAAVAQTPTPDAPRRMVWPESMLGPRVYLGVSILDLTPELRAHFGAPKDAGVMISEVRPESPAARAGIQVGDVLIRIGGDRVERFRDVTRAVADHKKGDKVDVELFRDHATKKLSVTLEEREGESLLERRKTMVIRPQDGGPERTIVIDGDEPFPAPTGEVMEQFFKTPGWQMKLDDMNECERVRKRLEEVEGRLKALEQKLASR